VISTVDALEETWPVRTATSFFDAPKHANRSLRADVPFALGIRKLMRATAVGSGPQVHAEIHRVSAKLGRRRDGTDDVDLFTVLPTSRAMSASKPGIREHNRRQSVSAGISQRVSRTFFAGQ
jgi:hypothetical protein